MFLIDLTKKISFHPVFVIVPRFQTTKTRLPTNAKYGLSHGFNMALVSGFINIKLDFFINLHFRFRFLPLNLCQPALSGFELCGDIRKTSIIIILVRTFVTHVPFSS